jgi:hypothetical protein
MALIATAAKLAGLALVAATTTVSSTASSTTPYLVTVDTKPQTTMIRTCGTQVWAVGAFTSVGSPGHSAVTRNNVVVFDQATGAISAVDPNVDGQVDAVTFSPDCSSAYLGGKFATVHGTAVKNLAKVSTSTGAVDTAFAHNAPARVYAVQYANGHLFVGGAFKTINGSTGATASYLTSLNPATGKVDGYANNLGISGTYPKNTTHIFKFFPSPDGTRLAVNGVFTTVLGQQRLQVFVLDLGTSSVSLNAWYAPLLNQTCTGAQSGESFYAKGVAWSADSQFLYLATTGFRGAPLCDSAVKFSASANSNQAVIWQNFTGGDSLYAAAASTNDVYVGGHMRWLDNPLGHDSCGPGCSPRAGIGDIDATTGKATPWNPGKTRGHGVNDLYLDPQGNLWVSSDAAAPGNCAGKFHPGICMFPHS